MKIAIITGANRGIGKSTALHVAKSGTAVILTYRSHRDEAEAVVAATKVTVGKRSRFRSM